MALTATQLAEQEKILEECRSQVLTQALQMKRCLDKNKLMDGLKHASNMLSELRTSELVPKHYYELYMSVMNEMRHLEQYLLEEYRKGRKVQDLYELVQYAGNILPRLYLLVTVGSVYIQVREHSVKEILRDMVEMCRGVQHPLRGLFLRHYLISFTKNILPTSVTSQAVDAVATGDASEVNTGEGGLLDSIDYVLLNFAEMNKLWVRMQYQGHTKDRTQREKERKDLKLLVGANLYALSSLDTLTVTLYTERVLPVILGQVINSKDPIAQEYVMEVIIHVFPDDFHLATLSQYLDACSSLHEEVDMKSIIGTLIERLTQYATREDGPGIPSDLQLFSIFSDRIENIIKTRPKMALEKVISMQASLLSLALKCYSHQPEYVNIVLASTGNILTKLEVLKLMGNSKVAGELVAMLRLPVDHYNNIILLSDMDGFAPLLQFLDYQPRKELASYLVENAINNACLVPDVEHTNKVLSLVDTLYKDQTDLPSDFDEADESWAAEVDMDLSLLAKFIHFFYSDDPNVQYLMLVAAREHLAVAVKEAGPRRRQFTLPALVFAALKLALRFHAIKHEDEVWEKKVGKILAYCRQLLDQLVTDEKAELALRLFLQCGLVVDQMPGFAQHDTLAYEFFSQALALYEDSMAESKMQFAAITLIVAALQRMTCFTEENHAPLRNQCCLAASKLFKKPDQARAVATSANLFWSSRVAGADSPDGGQQLRDSKRVADCLKKSMKTASQMVDANAKLQLYIDMLNQYIFFFNQGCPSITPQLLNTLLETIDGELASASASEESERLAAHLASTKKYLHDKRTALQTAGDALAESYAQLNLS